ncbi:flagellar basal body rod protein FlgD [Steroidobacter denitrificans]|uniref:Basal-body rod modification protein FlgD n=1 Tax=Steroidobacter denitrificans TaxID=465721 RepID=A0A127F850_STEDE|nr:flagellar basal body rod protein FlgD [Steroidobacter denitrificans]
MAAAQTKKSANNLGIDEFLTLMTTQLKNQDPLKPLEGTEFVAQLAQFGTVSGIQQMQGSMETLAESLRATQALSGTSLVGHDILASAGSVNFIEGTSVSGEFDVPAATSALQVRITDASGAVVRDITLAPTPGFTSFSWDGLRSDGAQAQSGEYSIQAIASVGGASESLDLLLAARVSSVTLDNGGTGLTLNTAGLGSVSLADVRRIM